MPLMAFEFCIDRGTKRVKRQLNTGHSKLVQCGYILVSYKNRQSVVQTYEEACVGEWYCQYYRNPRLRTNSQLQRAFSTLVIERTYLQRDKFVTFCNSDQSNGNQQMCRQKFVKRGSEVDTVKTKDCSH